LPLDYLTKKKKKKIKYAVVVFFCCKKKLIPLYKRIMFAAVIITHIHGFGVLTIVLLLPVKFEFHVKK
jgi:hypothetical protein